MKINKHIIAIFFIALVSLLIRLIAVKDAYPCCGDSGHFVQHGVALANGVQGAMSVYWSQGMILLAAWAESMGWDSRLTMQIATLLSGVVVPVLFYFIALYFLRTVGISLIAGLLVACSPSFVLLSINGFSEMPYMAFLFLGVVAGLYSRNKSVIYGVLAGAFIGMGGYFKGLDAAVAAFSFGVFKGWLEYQRGKKLPTRWTVIPLTAFVVLLPLCLFTYEQTGSFTPGSKGWGNFSAGLDWSNSKEVHAIEQSYKTKSMGEVAREIPSRIIHNAHDIMRIFNQHLFQKGFRVGTIWFFVIFTAVMWLLFKKEKDLLFFIFSMSIFQLFLLSIVFVHARNLFPTMSWVLLAFISAIGYLYKAFFERWKCITILLVGCFIFINAVYSSSVFKQEFAYWRYNNIAQTADRMREYGAEDDVIMSYMPQLSVEYYTNNPLKWVGMPYGKVKEVFKYADVHDVKFIVVSDSFRRHWPISSLVTDPESPLPEGWILVDTLHFDGDPEGWRYPAETMKVFRHVENVRKEKRENE